MMPISLTFKMSRDEYELVNLAMTKGLDDQHSSGWGVWVNTIKPQFEKQCPYSPWKTAKLVFEILQAREARKLEQSAVDKSVPMVISAIDNLLIAMTEELKQRGDITYQQMMDLTS